MSGDSGTTWKFIILLLTAITLPGIGLSFRYTYAVEKQQMTQDDLGRIEKAVDRLTAEITRQIAIAQEERDALGDQIDCIRAPALCKPPLPSRGR